MQKVNSSIDMETALVPPTQRMRIRDDVMGSSGKSFYMSLVFSLWSDQQSKGLSSARFPTSVFFLLILSAFIIHFLRLEVEKPQQGKHATVNSFEFVSVLNKLFLISKEKCAKCFDESNSQISPKPTSSLK